MSDQDPQDQIIESAVSLLKDVSPWFTVAITALLIIWAIMRARSAHFLFDKIWRFIGGGTINDPDLIKAWMDIRDIEGFRFRTGINFKTKSSLSHTLKWLEDNGMSLNDLSFAKDWISDSPWKFREPKIKLIKAFVTTAIVILGSLSLSMLMLTAESSVLLTIKSSKSTFWTDGTTAQNFKLSLNTPKFSATQKQCKDGKIKGVEDNDAKVICATLTPPAQKDLKKMILDQKIYSGYIVLIFVWLLILALRHSARATMAKKFHALPSPQTS